MAQACDQTTVVRMADDEQIDNTVILAVAEALDVSPIELETPLYEVIDGEALKNIFSAGNRGADLDSMRVEFTWAGCTVVVHGTGRVVVNKSNKMTAKVAAKKTEA